MTFTDMLMGSHGENLTFSVDTSSFLSPEADVAFTCEYRQPCLWGLPNKNKTTGVISAFSSQRPSGVFSPGMSAGISYGWGCSIQSHPCL